MSFSFDDALRMDVDEEPTFDLDEVMNLPNTSSRSSSGKMEAVEDNEYNELFNPRGGKRSKSYEEGTPTAPTCFKQLALSAADWVTDFLQARKQNSRPYTEAASSPPVTETLIHPEKQQPMHVYQMDGEALEAMFRRRYHHLHHIRILALAISAQASDLFDNETDYPETMMRELTRQAKSILGDTEYCSRLDPRQLRHLQTIAQNQAPFGLVVVSDFRYRAKSLPRDDQFFARYPYLAQPNRGNGYCLTV